MLKPPPPVTLPEGPGSGKEETDQQIGPLKAMLVLSAASVFLFVTVSLLGGGMSSQPVSPGWSTPGGDPDRGANAIEHYNCGSCHTISGIHDATARVGPLLTGYTTQSYVVGRLTNSPVNLVHWIENPQGIEPGSAMPNLGVTEADARDIAAYLYSSKNQ